MLHFSYVYIALNHSVSFFLFQHDNPSYNKPVIGRGKYISILGEVLVRILFNLIKGS